MPDKTSSPHGHVARVKMTDVAAAAGVHVSTVSRVLRGERMDRVSPTVANRIRAVALDLGYTTNPLAAGMRTRTTRSVGMIVHDISDPIYPPILSGVERYLGSAGYVVVLGNTGYDPAAEIRMLEQMQARMMDGVLLLTTRREDPAVARALDLRMPIVSVLRRTDAGLCSAVINDCAAGMREITRAALDLGHRDFAVIGAPQTLSTARDRLIGVTETLAEAGVSLPEDRLIFVPSMNAEEGRLAMQTLLARRPDTPDIVICVNDLVAIGALQACRASGLLCPNDISITGYNDIPLLEMLAPPLASVAMDLSTIGERAAALLLEHLANPQMPTRIETVAPALRLRGSLAAAPSRVV